MSDQETQHPLYWDTESSTGLAMPLIVEEPLSIRVDGKPYAVVMRTPGDEIAHVAGFCLSEGIADRLEDIESLAFCDGDDTNVVTATLKADRRALVTDLTQRRGYISQTSCGICGKEIIADLAAEITPLDDPIQLDAHGVHRCLNQLDQWQPLRRNTGAAHAAAVFDRGFKLLGVAEDVGRHNALDKVIGRLLLDDALQRAALLVLSSRISYELVQKSARAAIPVIAAISRPTSLAVALASRMNITLACRSRKRGLYIFCGSHRLSTHGT